MPAKIDAYDRVNRQLGWGMRLLGAWLALVTYFLLWEALDYRGIVAQLAEYQFIHFDRYWPTLTFTALVVLVTAPFLLILWLIRARQRRDERLGDARMFDHRILLGQLGRVQNFFAGVALGCLLCVGILAYQMLTLPDDSYQPRSIVIGSPDALGPGDGRAVLTGFVNLQDTAQFNEDLFLVRRTLYFAPIRSGPKDTSPLRYFVQVRRNDVTGNFQPVRIPEGGGPGGLPRDWAKPNMFTPYVDGMLLRNSLPGEIATLYRFVGYKLAPDSYVLFESNEPIRWRIQMLAGEFLLVAIIAALLMLYFGYRGRRVRKLARERAEA